MHKTNPRRWQTVASVASACTLLIALAVWIGAGDGGSTVPAGQPTSAPSLLSPSAGEGPANGQIGTLSDGATQPDVSGEAPTPTEGSLQPVPVRAVRVKKPVSLNHGASFGDGISVRVKQIDSVKGKAERPGEISGAALRVTLTMENRSSRSERLNRTVVDLEYGENETPAVALTEPGGKSFPRRVQPAAKVSGTYVFAVPMNQRDHIRVRVSRSAVAPTVVFTGDARAR